ncbi:MAG: TolB family protein [Candidatus Limnocylindrales bacterium]
MARPSDHGSPGGRLVPALGLVAGVLAIVLVGGAVVAMNNALNGPGESSPGPTFAGGQVPPTSSFALGSPVAPTGSDTPGGPSAAPGISLPPAPDRPIAYSQTVGSSTIWSMQPGGSATQLFQDKSSTGAAWSRDGRQIAFVRQVGTAPGELWVMSADGSSAHALTTGAGVVGHPSWSPSGDRIAFAAAYDTGGVQLWIIRSTGGDPTQDSYVTGSPGAPSWSPDGQSLVYVNEINGRSGVYIADPGNASSPTIGLFGVTDGVNRSPTWSPDGSRIAFDSTLNGTDQIWLINADGSAPDAISPAALAAAWPAWSPDGKQLVFQGLRGSDTDLYVMPADGSTAPVDIAKDPRHAAFDAAWW